MSNCIFVNVSYGSNFGGFNGRYRSAFLHASIKTKETFYLRRNVGTIRCFRHHSGRIANFVRRKSELSRYAAEKS